MSPIARRVVTGVILVVLLGGAFLVPAFAQFLYPVAIPGAIPTTALPRTVWTDTGAVTKNGTRTIWRDEGAMSQ